MLKRWAAGMRGIPWVVGLLAAVAVILAIAWVLFVPAADWLATHDVGQVTGPARALRLQTARDAARGRLLTLGAGLFALSALVYTARNFSLSREGQVTDRYTKAIEQLGSEKLDVRIGGIYALERVARDSARDHPAVMEVLAAFIREHSRDQQPSAGPGTERPAHVTRPDMQAAITVIGRRDSKRDRERINLIGANLTGADLAGAKLAAANLADANLTGADLAGADLAGAYLARANLAGADLTSAKLAGVVLTGADLAGAYLAGVVLTGANLADANLTSANLAWANLAGANLAGANLASANLAVANLTGAYLAGADLTSANLAGAMWPHHLTPPPGWERAHGGRTLQRVGENPDATAQPEA